MPNFKNEVNSMSSYLFGIKLIKYILCIRNILLLLQP